MYPRKSVIIGGVLGLAAILTIAGLVSRKKPDSPSPLPSPRPSPTPPPSGPETLEQMGARIGRDVFTIQQTAQLGCMPVWRHSAVEGRAALNSHVSDFFAPAVARAQASGASGTDQLTVAVFQLLVPACPAPPGVIGDFPLAKALTDPNSLSSTQKTQLDVLLRLPTVDVWVTIRGLVGALEASS